MRELESISEIQENLDLREILGDRRNVIAQIDSATQN